MKKNKLDEFKVVNAIQDSNRNSRYLSESATITKSRIYTLKYLCWLIALVFFSPRKKMTSKRFVTMINPPGAKRIKERYKDDLWFCFAKLNDSIDKVKKNVSVLSPYSRWTRVYRLFCSILFFIRNRKALKGSLHYSIEYYLIARFIWDHEINEIIFQGLYDRYNTLFSRLGKDMGIMLIGIQDGACVTNEIPVKIHCDKLFCFNRFEEKKFREYIENEDCQYIYTNFVSLLKWDEYSKKTKPIIAIASQDWFTVKTKEIIRMIAKKPESKNYTIMVFPHYREDLSQYSDISLEYPEIIIENVRRYYNIDILVTFYSTIVYDFWTVNSNLRIVCLHIPGFEPAYYERDEVVVCESISELVKVIYYKG